MCVLPAWVLEERPGSLRVLHSIVAVPRTALLNTEMSDVVPEFCWSNSPCFGIAASIPIGTTLDFTFYIYFTIFLC